MSELHNQPIGLIVAQNLAAAAVFEAHDMDFCCHGKQTLAAACAAHNVSVGKLEAELAALTRQPAADAPDADAMSLTELARHIIATHHVYTQKALPAIAGHLDTIVRVHGANHPQLAAIRQLFTVLKNELEPHLSKEEESVFPGIEMLEKSGGLPAAGLNGVTGPIAGLEHEHEHAGQVLDRINALADGYRPPADACNTYRLTLDELQKLEQDLHLHIAKENYLLFPKAITLATSLGKQS